MATFVKDPVTGAEPRRSEKPANQEKPVGGRLVSLDAYRGFIMLMLVSEGFGLAALASHPNWAWLAAQFDHTAWEGCTFWDLIQPAFTFMVGVAMPFAFARRIAQGETTFVVFRHVAWRALILIALSNIYSNWGGSRPREHLVFQLINVLSQIAFGYVLCFLITRLRFAYQSAIAAAMLAGYWALFVLFPGPQGAFSQTGNIGAVIDLKLLGYNYSGYYTTINFIGNAVTILFGCWAGMLLSSGKSHAYKLKVLAACAAGGFAMGLALAPFNPMVKRLWKRWTFPFVVLGTNSLFVYSLGQIGITGWLNRGLQSFTGNFSFLGDFGAIPQHILVLAGLWYLCYWLYQRKIFLKI
jgi:heparan-alpha-glucosaminide N-acetyltransferase